MKFLLISPKNRTVFNFRGDLVTKIKNLGYDVIVTGPDRIDVDRIEALGVTFKEIPMKKTGTSVFGDLKYCYSLYKLMKKEKPDVTLGYTVKPVVYGGLAAWLSGVKNRNSMVTGGGYTFVAKTAKAKFLGLLVKFLYKLSFTVTQTVIFQNSDDLTEFTEKRLVNKKKCHVVNGSGVNMEKFYQGPLPENMSFLMVARLLKSKGVSEYLQAAANIKKKYPDIQFKLLGKLEYEMQDAIPEADIVKYINDGTVTLLPETNDMRGHYENCSVYVLPSYREGTPRTVLEAMSVGRPIITTDANGCRSTVKDGVNGFLVKVGEVESLEKAMLRFIENKDLIPQMGAESVKYCLEKFEVNKVNNNMCKYMNLTKGE